MYFLKKYKISFPKHRIILGHCKDLEVFALGDIVTKLANSAFDDKRHVFP